MPNHILIAGGTGLIGSALVSYWQNQGKLLTVLGRSTPKIVKKFGQSVTALDWQSLEYNPMYNLETVDCIVNLCGASIGDKLWSKKRKKQIIDSRVQTSQKLVRAAAKLGAAAPRIYNASAVGTYGLQAINHALPSAYDESAVLTHPSNSFLALVGQTWEKSAVTQAPMPAVTYLRFGVVLSDKGGALAKMALPFKFGLGGVMGSGRQAMSWVHLDDCIRAIDFIIANPTIRGPVNIVAPECVSHQQFAHTLAKVLHRPCFMPYPTTLIKCLMGEMGEELILNGQHVIPTKLQNAGYEFEYPTLREALSHICAAD